MSRERAVFGLGHMAQTPIRVSISDGNDQSANLLQAVWVNKGSSLREHPLDVIPREHRIVPPKQRRQGWPQHTISHSPIHSREVPLEVEVAIAVDTSRSASMFHLHRTRHA